MSVELKEIYKIQNTIKLFRKAYIVQDENGMDSSNECEKEKEIHLYLMTNHEKNKVNSLTSKFNYNNLFCICTMLKSG